MAKILVTDDSSTILNIMRRTLEKEGYLVIPTSNGKEAIEKATLEKPDLLILDFILPDMTGVDICRNLRANEAFKNTPMVLLTGRSSEEEKKMADEAGINAFITKPFDLEDFLAKVAGLLNR